MPRAAFAASSGSSTLGAVGGKLFLVRGTSLGQLARVINREAPSSAVYFQTDQARPAATMRPFLLRLGRALAENPRRALRVERHVDQRGAGARRRSRPSASAIGFGFGFGFGSRRPVRAGGAEVGLRAKRNPRGCGFLQQPRGFSPVGETGFEPATPWSRTKCSTRLSHSPVIRAAKYRMAHAVSTQLPITTCGSTPP